MEDNLKAILDQQNEEGLFPAYKARKGDKIVESESTKIDNIGVHTFILEKLLELYPKNESVKTIFQKGIDYLIKNSINSDGRYLWRWLKEPSREDYLYPPDYDDTLRARTVIEIAKKNGFDIPEEFKDFDYTEFLLEGMTPNGIFTFVGKKPGNVVCPVVNTNILYSYGLYLKSREDNQMKDIVFNKIKEYVKGVVGSDEFQLSNFSRLSRFYLSHMFLTYLISEQKEIFEGNILSKVKKRVEKEKGNYRNVLETAWATLTLLNLEGNKEIIEKGTEQIQQSMTNSYLWNSDPFYQHQRLNNIFGSSAGTSIFCIEALEKVKQQ